MTRSNTLALLHHFSVRIRILRNPATIGGVRGEPQVLYESLMIGPIDPISEEAIERFVLETPIDMFESFAPVYPVIKTGDTINAHETEETYDVKHSAVWSQSHQELILEKIRVVS